MLKNLKTKFILTIIFIISLIMLIILLSINIILNTNMNKKTIDTMREIAINDGIPHMKNPSFKPMPPEDNHIKQFDISFSVKLNKQNKITETIYPIQMSYDEIQLNTLIDYVLSNKNDYGQTGNISFFKMSKPYGQIIVFLDTTNNNQVKHNLIYISLIVFILSLLFIFIVSYFLTEWMIKPVKETFEIQKQFIANASHELKTPLSIISTNVSILDYEDDIIEQKKWIKNVKTEVFKMNDLINKLLLLSKVENFSKVKPSESINISTVILNSILSYESIIFEKNRILKYNIPPNILAPCIEDDLSTIIRIFLDNAIKYSNKNDIIEINLEKKHNNISLSIFNTGVGIKNEDIKYIFDRFYRVDTSRNKEIEGYGLGLSIAKKIIDNNKWQIKVDTIYNKWIKFTIDI